MKRLKIYFIHSTKFDYQNLIYKKVLSSEVCITQELMLPQTKEYQDKYTKDLMNKADIIIVEVSHPSFGLGLELKFLSKIDKPKLFLSLDNTVPKKYKKLVPKLTETTEENYLSTIENFIKEHAETLENKKEDNTLILGEI